MAREVVGRRGNKVQFRETLEGGVERTWEEDYDKPQAAPIASDDNPLNVNPNNVFPGGKYWVGGNFVNAAGEVIERDGTTRGLSEDVVDSGQLQSKAAQNIGTEGALAEGDNDPDNPEFADPAKLKASDERFLASGQQSARGPDPAVTAGRQATAGPPKPTDTSGIGGEAKTTPVKKEG